ncbi:Cytochrome P450 monooxygenase aflN [Hyphodiscus hymeniophilus]|uniref:Cytochrome P450 monooxygenase aflN n=1 Tax=Hyphodiscus hymeniophilus TaxID=353542 RepID=A0A9P7AV33_9HELO|nr:Cytochrome P450 monooxygenase aflN [Hyphodiscus hymeniophilus]
MNSKPLLAVFFTLASAWLIQFFYRFYTRRRFFKGLPQPPHSMLWGHLKIMGEVAATLPPNMHPQAYLTAIAHKYDLHGIFYIDLWPISGPQVVLTDPDLMDQVTLIKPTNVHPMADDFLAPMVGRNGIATSNGAVWKKTHNAMAPAFSWGHIRSLTGLIVEECEHFRSSLDKLAMSGKTFSMEALGTRLVFDVIARVVFNLSLNAQTKGSTYLDDLMEMIALSEAQLSFNPVVKMRAWLRRKHVLGRLHPSITEKIMERFNLLREEKIVPSRKDPYSILDLMLREQLQEVQGEGNAAQDLSPEYLELMITKWPRHNDKYTLRKNAIVLEPLKSFVLTIQYIYMLLSKNPKVLQKLRDEHTRVFHSDPTESINILQDSPAKLNELEYTTAVIKETLRLFPVGFMVREAEPGATIRYNDTEYPIAGNDLVLVTTPHTVHYDPKFFANPASFQPERWLDADAEIPRSYFRTFGRGPRACLGQNLAQDELRIILLCTVREFAFEMVGMAGQDALKVNAEPRTSYTDLDTVFGDCVFQALAIEARPRGGMWMRVEKSVGS